MSNKIVQLENEAGDNIYPLAGGALTGSISKTMLEEGVFEGPELSEPSTVAYVATDNIQDGAVTSDKIDWTTSSLTLKSGFGGTATLYRFGSLRILSLKNITGITNTDATICDLQATDAPLGSMAAIPVSGFSGSSWATFMLIVLSSSPGPRVNCHGAPGAVNAADYTLTWFV